MVRCWDLLPIYFFISTLTIWWWLLILIKYQPCCILSEIMGLFNNIDVLQANCFSVRWWKTRQCYEDRCIFCGLKNPSAESQMGFKITKPYPGRAEASTNTHTSLYRHVITQTGKAEVCTSNFQLKGFSLSNFNFDYFFCQNIMVTVFPVFLCRTKSLITLDFRLSILIITKGSPLRFFHFNSVFRFVAFLLLHQYGGRQDWLLHCAGCHAGYGWMWRSGGHLQLCQDPLLQTHQHDPDWSEWESWLC